MTMAVLSVAESELHAMSALCQLGLNFPYILDEMGIMQRPSPITAQTDSAAAMGFAAGSGKKPKIRHVDQRMEWVQELKDIDLFEWVHVPSAINKADILTKVLDKVKFGYAMEYILNGVIPQDHLDKVRAKAELAVLEEFSSRHSNMRHRAKFATLTRESAALSQDARIEMKLLIYEATGVYGTI